MNDGMYRLDFTRGTVEKIDDGASYSQWEIQYAKTMLACPWYRGEGICASGCMTEPRCQTEVPLEGWEAIAESESA